MHLGATNNQFVEKCIIIPQFMKIDVTKAFSGNFQCYWEKNCVPFSQPATEIKWLEFLSPARLEMLEKVSNSQPKLLAIGNFPAAHRNTLQSVSQQDSSREQKIKGGTDSLGGPVHLRSNICITKCN